MMNGNAATPQQIEEAIHIYDIALNNCRHAMYETDVWYTTDQYEHPHTTLKISRVSPPGYAYVAEYTCWEFDPSAMLPQGITASGPDTYQFSHNRQVFNRCRSYRMTFVDQPEFWNNNLTVSHLCHNNKCHNPAHLTLEPLDVNKGRNGCPGGPCCRHRHKCMIPGPTHDY